MDLDNDEPVDYGELPRYPDCDYCDPMYCCEEHDRNPRCPLLMPKEPAIKIPKRKE